MLNLTLFFLHVLDFHDLIQKPYSPPMDSNKDQERSHLNFQFSPINLGIEKYMNEFIIRLYRNKNYNVSIDLPRS